MQIIMILIAFGAFISLFVNTGQKLFLWLRPLFMGVSPIAFGILYGVTVTVIMVLFVLSRIPNSRIPRVVFLADHYALGFSILVMLFVNAMGLLLFLLRLFRLLPSPLPQGAAIAVGLSAIVLPAVLSVYGTFHASAIQTKGYETELQESVAETDSMRIVLISDLHIGYVIDERQIEKVVTAVNEAEPDLVCIAGDIFDGDITSVRNPSTLQELFREISAPYGVYACLGNHDAGAGYEGMLEFLDKSRIHLLQDEEVLIDGKVILAGRKDSGPIGWQGEKRGPLKADAESDLFGISEEMGTSGKSYQQVEFPRIVLDHRPENIDEYSKSTDLVLCGHTHRGQMFPFNLVTRAAFKVDYGYYRQNEESPQVIVTSGAGTWGPPMRIGMDSEIAVIQVTFPAADVMQPE